MAPHEEINEVKFSKADSLRILAEVFPNLSVNRISQLLDPFGPDLSIDRYIKLIVEEGISRVSDSGDPQQNSSRKRAGSHDDLDEPPRKLPYRPSAPATPIPPPGHPPTIFHPPPPGATGDNLPGPPPPQGPELGGSPIHSGRPFQGGFDSFRPVIRLPPPPGPGEHSPWRGVRGDPSTMGLFWLAWCLREKPGSDVDEEERE